MAKRLRKLRVTEISCVHHAANPGAKVMLLKRDGTDAKDRTRAELGELLAKRAGTGQPIVFISKSTGERWALPADADIAEPMILSAGGLGLEVELPPAKQRGEPIAKVEGDMQQMETVDIAKAMENRIATMMKRDPNIRSTASAMLRLAESRDPADQELWRGYKTGTAPAGAVAKAEDEFSVKKALKRMSKRVEEIMAADPTIRSRESAIAKIASSRDPDDRRLWQRYKSVPATDQFVISGDTHAQPRRPSDVAFDALVTAIRASNPGMSDATARQWARATQAHKPPSVQRLVDYRL
jgi:hypothetical protein